MTDDDRLVLFELEELDDLDGVTVTLVKAGTDAVRLQDADGNDIAVAPCAVCGVLGVPHLNYYRVIDPSVFADDDIAAT